MYSGSDYLLVKIESSVVDHKVLPDGSKFYFDISFKPEDSVATTGVIKAIPRQSGVGSSKAILSGINKTTADIIPEWEVGDTVYFRFWSNVPENVLLAEGELLYKIWLGDVFAVERNGQVIPIGGHVLLSIPPVVAAKESPVIGLPSETEYDRGTIAHIGTPLKNCSKPDVAIGDMVIVACEKKRNQRKAYERYTIAGQEYRITTQDQILCAI